MIEIKVPDLGESISEATIIKWLKNRGDVISQGDLLLELETDKVNLEINAEQDGILDQIMKDEGATVQIGEVIGAIRSSDESGNAAAGKSGGGEAAGQVGAGSIDHAANAGSAGHAGNAGERTEVVVGSSSEENQSFDAGNDSAPYSASPAARKLARERGINLSQVQRDPIGRIYPDDVKTSATSAALSAISAAPAASNLAPNTASNAVSGTAPNAAANARTIQSGQPIKQETEGRSERKVDEPGKPIERKRMSRRRLTIANHLVEAQRTAAMLTTFNEVDMTAILDIRRRRKQAFQEKHDVGLGFMSFFTKAVVGALKAFPMLNAEIDGEDVLFKKFYDIGIAVAAKEGLVVPVVRDADRLSFAAIEKQIAELAGKARSNTLALSDLRGGTFTITNGGVFGSLLSTPILNTPQVGILGMHKIQLRPVAIDAERMENRSMMYIALSYDHRIVDGSEAVRFLVAVKDLLEDPETLLLEG